jgi:hypothetical protein
MRRRFSAKLGPQRRAKTPWAHEAILLSDAAVSILLHGDCQAGTQSQPASHSSLAPNRVPRSSRRPKRRFLVPRHIAIPRRTCSSKRPPHRHAPDLKRTLHPTTPTQTAFPTLRSLPRKSLSTLYTIPSAPVHASTQESDNRSLARLIEYFPPSPRPPRRPTTPSLHKSVDAGSRLHHPTSISCTTPESRPTDAVPCSSHRQALSTQTTATDTLSPRLSPTRALTSTQNTSF